MKLPAEGLMGKEEKMRGVDSAGGEDKDEEGETTEEGWEGEQNLQE